MGIRDGRDFTMVNRESIWDRYTSKRTSSVQENLVSRVIAGTDSLRDQ